MAIDTAELEQGTATGLETPPSDVTPETGTAPAPETEGDSKPETSFLESLTDEQRQAILDADFVKKHVEWESDKKAESARRIADAAATRRTEEKLSRWVDQGGPQKELRSLFRKAVDAADEPDEQAITDVLASYAAQRDQRAVNIFHELVRSEMPKDYRVPREDVVAVETAIEQYRANKGPLDAIFVADMRTLARAIAETELVPSILKEREDSAKAKADAKAKAEATQQTSRAREGQPAPTKVGGGTPNKPMSWEEISKKYTDNQWSMLRQEDPELHTRLVREANDLANTRK